MRLKIFSDKCYLPEGTEHSVILYPFWGKISENEKEPTTTRYDRYTKVGRSIFKITSSTNADVAVMPMNWEHILHDKSAQDLAFKFARKINKAKKKIAIFFLERFRSRYSY